MKFDVQHVHDPRTNTIENERLEGSDCPFDYFPYKVLSIREMIWYGRIFNGRLCSTIVFLLILYELIVHFYLTTYFDLLLFFQEMWQKIRTRLDKSNIQKKKNDFLQALFLCCLSYFLLIILLYTLQHLVQGLGFGGCDQHSQGLETHPSFIVPTDSENDFESI